MTKEQVQGQIQILWQDQFELFKKLTACSRGECEEINALLLEQEASIDDPEKWEVIETKMARIKQARQNAYDRGANEINRLLITLTNLERV